MYYPNYNLYFTAYTIQNAKNNLLYSVIVHKTKVKNRRGTVRQEAKLTT